MRGDNLLLILLHCRIGSKNNVKMLLAKAQR